MHGFVADDVVHVALQQHMRVQRDVDLGECGDDVFLGVQVDAAERLFDFACAGLGEVHVAAVGVGVVVGVGDELADQFDDLQPRRLPVRGAGQHQRHQRLVDQHRVGLIDKGHIGIGRYQVVDVGHQLIPQYVEADLVDRGVGDVAVVGRAAFLARRLRGDPADRQIPWPQAAGPSIRRRGGPGSR